MDATMRSVEEEILKARFPITYAIYKSGLAPEQEGILSWCKWYAKESEGENWTVFAQISWLPDEEYDVGVADCKDGQVAEGIASTHNVALERVQAPDFGESK